MQGIWPGSSFKGVNAVAASHGSGVIATAEESGLVKLFRYPCTEARAQAMECRAHSSHVTRVAFSANDQFVVTVGGHDKTVCIWETDLSGADAKRQDDPSDEILGDEYE